MKIAIDINSALGKKTGIGYYVHNLLNQYKNYHNEFDFHYFFDPKNIDFTSLDRVVWSNIKLPPKYNKIKADILHIPGFSGPFFSGSCKKITTVHDLIGIIYPQNLRFPSRLFWSKWLPICVKTSKHIIADSFNTKNDIIRLLKIPENKITVIYLAADSAFKPIHNQEYLESIRTKYSLPQNFILHVGTLEPRKNVPNLIEAFARYSSENSSDLKLVICGLKSWGYPKVLETIERLKIKEKVFMTDYIDDNDLPALYNLSSFFASTSLYEGFGLPVLEAMACAKAVICSDSSSLPEVTGKAALLVNPLKNDEITKAIKLLDKNTSLCKELSMKSLEQASKFSWEKTAQETLEIYRKVAK